MLQIRLKKVPSTEGGGGGVVKPLPAETVTVACPDHLVLADLPVAKGIGAATATSLVKTLGRRSRRLLGERVHFCVGCDFPIAIYGRLNPCEHVFCLDCARSDSICYLCDERIQKIQTIKLMEGIFICAAPHCLKSFLKRSDFESHIHERHADLLQPNAEKEDGNESESQSFKQPTASESSVRAPLRPVFSPNSNPQLYDREDKTRWQQPRDQQPSRAIMQQKPPPMFGQVQNYQPDPQSDGNLPPGFERPGPHNRFQQSFDPQGTPQRESSQQQGLVADGQYPEYPPVHSMQPPNFVVPMNSNPMPPFGVPPAFSTEGSQQFYGAPYGMPRPDSVPEVGAEQTSLLGFPPGPGGVNFPASYPQFWNPGPTGVPFEVPSGGQGQGMADGFANMPPDSQGKTAYYQGYTQNSGGVPMIPPLMPPAANKGTESIQGGNAMDPRDGKGILAPPSMSLQPPPPPGLPPQAHMPQHKRGKYYSGEIGREGQSHYSSGEMGREGQGFGWPHENRDRDGFGNSQD